MRRAWTSSRPGRHRRRHGKVCFTAPTALTTARADTVRRAPPASATCRTETPRRARPAATPRTRSGRQHEMRAAPARPRRTLPCLSPWSRTSACGLRTPRKPWNAGSKTPSDCPTAPTLALAPPCAAVMPRPHRARYSQRESARMLSTNNRAVLDAAVDGAVTAVNIRQTFGYPGGIPLPGRDPTPQFHEVPA